MRFQALASVAVVALTIFSCRLAPPLRVAQEGDDIVIGVETLGEYPTTVSRVRITESYTDDVVLDLIADSPNAQLLRLILRTSDISTEMEKIPSWAHYKVIVPSDGGSCVFRVDQRYDVEAWGIPDGPRAKVSFVFKD